MTMATSNVLMFNNLQVENVYVANVNFAIATQFDSASNFKDGLALVYNGELDKFGYIDTSGKLVIMRVVLPMGIK